MCGSVGTADGLIAIAPHWMASGFISDVAGCTGDDLDMTVAYKQALFSAWGELTGDMPTADLLALLQSALINMLADRVRAGSGGGSAA